MSTSTPHLSLLKADPDELVNVNTQINQNYDKLDASALNHNSRLTVVEAVAGISEWEVWNPAVVRIGTNSILAATKLFEFKLSGDICYCSVRITNIPAATYTEGYFNFTLPYVLADKGGFAGNAIGFNDSSDPNTAGSLIDFSHIWRRDNASTVAFYQKVGQSFDGTVDFVTGIPGSSFVAEFYYRTTGVAV